MAALVQLAEAVRWLRGRSGPPPQFEASDQFAATAAAGSLIEAISAEKVELVERAVELSRLAVLDHRRNLRDRAIEIRPEAALLSERRALRLPQSAGPLE